MKRTLVDGIPPALVSGPLKARHILILYVACVFVGAAMGFRFFRGADGEVRLQVMRSVAHSLAAVLMLLVALVIPEIRRSLPLLYSLRGKRLDFVDAASFLALNSTWVLGVAMLLFNASIVFLNPELFHTMGFRTRPLVIDHAKVAVLLFMSTCIAPFVEELVFRGLLQNLWMNRFGVWPGILMSAIAFGAIHGQYAGMAIGAGVLYSLVYLRYASLWPGMLLHAAYNLLVFPVTPWIDVFLRKDPQNFTDPASWLPQIVASTLFVPSLIFFWRRFRPTA
jgi:membrane protease YdiL (CAAX protease family)